MLRRNKKKRIVILGVTGSVGQQALQVIRGGSFELVGLSFRMNFALAQKVASEFKVRHTYCSNNTGTCASYEDLLDKAKPDIVLNAVSGFAGLEPTLAVLKRGIPLALANKESLVTAGKHVMALAKEKKTPLYPVDSEHASLYDLMRADRNVEELIITASGGPFMKLSLEQTASVSHKEVVAHPKWAMGAKISVDSATMMNKALELVEAHWLFGVKVRAVIHPQAIVHAIVRYTDNSYAALLAAPDMRLAIQRAINGFKHNGKALIAPLDFACLSLDFIEPDLQRWPAIGLAERCLARADSTLPVIVNALNEKAVALFLADSLEFHEIVPYVVANIDKYEVIDSPSIEQIIALHNQIAKGGQ